MLSSIKLLLVVMAAVESGNNPAAVGDGGRALGPYQIHRTYWQDSGVSGAWEHCRDPEYAQQVILAYWRRYCPRALERGDLEVLARVHNGGPRGHHKSATLRYWSRVRAAHAGREWAHEPDR